MLWENIMQKIVSASRRTDIPAYYGRWFKWRIKDAVAGYLNPFNRKPYLVSLKPEDVLCFVFWSKNFIPFTDTLQMVHAMGYNLYLHYTINNYPGIFEQNVPFHTETISNLITLTKLCKPIHISWRYDPIIISDLTGFDYHIKNFKALAAALSGFVSRCYISYVCLYGKVQKSFKNLMQKTGVTIIEPEQKQKIELANVLADIADTYGIQLYSCCNDFLVNERIKKSSCIDGILINDLYYPGQILNLKKRPTRNECGCIENVDIGIYDSCLHGCQYCYASNNYTNFTGNKFVDDPRSLFLGYDEKTSQKWVQGLNKEYKTILFGKQITQKNIIF